jgi:D-alanyl-D-alanine carboxypeptidase
MTPPRPRQALPAAQSSDGPVGPRRKAAAGPAHRMALAARAAVLLAGLGAAAAAPAQTAPAAGPATAADPAATRALDPLVAAAMKSQNIPGLSLAVVRGERVLVAKGYGVADVEGKVAATAQTVYPIGSISKQFTAAGILFLAERGRLALSDPAARHLPVPRRHAQRVTIEQLLRHTSGVPEFLMLPAFQELNRGSGGSVDELHAVLDREPLSFVPGTRWSYSNTGYQWLARIIEHLNGEPYEQFLSEVMFKHVGLPSLHHCGTLPAVRIARGYAWRQGRWTPAPQENMALARGDGGLCGNALDLARWARALARSDALAPSSYARLVDPTVLADGTPAPYGMGVSLLPLDGERARVSHNGAIGGYQATLAYYPDDDLAIAVLTNRAGAFTEAIEKAIARRLLNQPAPRVTDAPLPPGLADRLVGEWEIGVAGLPVRVSRKEQRLWLEMPPPGVTSALRHQGNGRFVAAGAPDAIEVQYVEGDGGPEELAITMANMQWFARRGSAAALAAPDAAGAPGIAAPLPAPQALPAAPSPPVIPLPPTAPEALPAAPSQADPPAAPPRPAPRPPPPVRLPGPRS